LFVLDKNLQAAVAWNVTDEEKHLRNTNNAIRQEVNRVTPQFLEPTLRYESEDALKDERNRQQHEEKKLRLKLSYEIDANESLKRQKIMSHELQEKEKEKAALKEGK
jgi:hypothetical protein